MADHSLLSEENESRLQHRHAVVVHDLCSYWICCVPTQNKTAQKTMKRLQKFVQADQKPGILFIQISLWNLFVLVKIVLAWRHVHSTLWTEHPHTSHFLVVPRMCNDVSHDIGSSVSARHTIFVSCACVFDLSSTLSSHSSFVSPIFFFILLIFHFIFYVDRFGVKHLVPFREWGVWPFGQQRTSHTHHSESNGIAQNAVRRVNEGTSQAFHKATECSCYFRKFSRQIGRQLVTVRENTWHSIWLSNKHQLELKKCFQPPQKTKSRFHQFGTKMLPGMFSEDALDSGAGWTGDLIIADRSLRQETQVQRSVVKKLQEVFLFLRADGSTRQEGHAQRQISRQQRVESCDAGAVHSTFGRGESDLLHCARGDSQQEGREQYRWLVEQRWK